MQVHTKYFSLHKQYRQNSTTMTTTVYRINENGFTTSSEHNEHNPHTPQLLTVRLIRGDYSMGSLTLFNYP